MRLLEVYREIGPEARLDAALDGREKSPEAVKKLYNFVLNNFGSQSTVTEAFWKVCAVFLRASTELTSKELEKIRHPFPTAGEPGFESILDEMRERKS